MNVRGPLGQNLRHRTLTLQKRQRDGATRLAGIGIIANSARQPTETLMSSIQTLVKGQGMRASYDAGIIIPTSSVV